MTNQEIFDRVVKHLLIQNEVSVDCYNLRMPKGV
jgi:hypothetical protein